MFTWIATLPAHDDQDEAVVLYAQEHPRAQAVLVPLNGKRFFRTRQELRDALKRHGLTADLHGQVRLAKS